jgi:hypothetical protein
MPRPLIDGVASMLATDEANTELAATFTESSKVMDQGAPDPLGAADIDAAISALEAMDPAAAAPPAPAPGA